MRRKVFDIGPRVNLARFWQRVWVRGEDDCWPYLGPTNDMGYGRFWADGREVFAHVLSFILHHGPIPQGKEVCHDCRTNRTCCNPRHLYADTHSNNTFRRWRDGTLRIRQRVLTDEQVREVILSAGTVSITDAARAHGISPQQVSKIRRCDSPRRIHKEVAGVQGRDDKRPGGAAGEGT